MTYGINVGGTIFVLVSLFGIYSLGFSDTIIDQILPAPNSDLIAQEIFNLTNQERQTEGLNPLIWDDSLASIARLHSEDMFKRDFFGHYNPNNESPTDRAKAKGIPVTNGMWVGIGENIVLMPTGNVERCLNIGIARCSVNAWMNSEGHRENILNKNYDVIGVGVYCTKTTCWETQDFR